MKIDSDHRKALSEINITPFVDVMLVLLIIFMVTAPLVQHGIKVDLPQAKTGALKKENDELIVSIDKKGSIYLLDNPYTYKEFKQKIKYVYKERENQKIFLSADRKLPYGYIIKTMAAIKNAGFISVGLITDPISKKQTKKTL